MYRYRKITAKAFLIITAIILAASILLVIFVRINKISANEIYFGNYRLSLVGSSSMYPEYKKGSIVIIKAVDYSEINRKDVIAFSINSSKSVEALHRVVDVRPDGLVTQGDSNESQDGGLVTRNNFIGKEVYHTNFFVNYASAISSYQGLTKYLVLPVFWLIFSLYAYKKIPWLIKKIRLILLLNKSNKLTTK